MDGSRLCCLLIAYLFYWRDEATYVLHWPTPEEEKLIQAHTDYPITYPDNGDGSSGSTAGPIMLIPVTSQIDKRVKKGVLRGMRALRLLRKRFFLYFTLKNDKRFYRNDFMWAIIFHQFDKSFRPHQSFLTAVINAVRHLLPLPLFSRFSFLLLLPLPFSLLLFPITSILHLLLAPSPTTSNEG